MLSKTSLHAIRAVIRLAELPPDSYAGAAQLAEEVGAPPNYLGKLLQQLGKAGVLISQKGLGGGFRLAGEPEELVLLDIVEPLEQISRWQGCILGRTNCSCENPCPLHARYAGVRDSYLELLQETTLASLTHQHALDG